MRTTTSFGPRRLPPDHSIWRRRALLTVALLATALTVWLGAAHAPTLAQISPAQEAIPAAADAQISPQITPTDDPIVATVTPLPAAATDVPTDVPTDLLTVTPTETPTETPLETPQDPAVDLSTPSPAETTPGPLDPSAPVDLPEGDADEGDLSEEDAIETTPESLLILPAVDATVTPEATAPADPLAFVGRVVDSASRAAVWIWFGCGSVIFFAVAGLVAGLIFSQRERRRYRIYEVVPEENNAHRITTRDDEQPGDDFWPASLP